MAVLLCGALRIWIIAHSEMIARDGVIYLAMARDLREDPAETIRTSLYHPGYPVAVAVTHTLLPRAWAGDNRVGWERAGQTVSVAAAMMSLVAVAILATMVFNPRVALFTVLLFGSGTKWTHLGANVLSDTLAIAFQLWGVVAALVALRLLRRRRRTALAAAAAVGLCAGLGYWTRGEAALVAPAAAALWLLYAAGRRVRWRRAIVASALAALMALLCAMPYMAAIGGITRKHILGTKIPAIRATNAPTLPPPPNPPERPPVLLALAGQIAEAAHPVVATLGALWAVVWGLDKFRRRPEAPWIPRPLPEGAIITAIIVAASVPVLAVHYHTTGFLVYRYVMFIAALLAPLGGAGVIILGHLATTAIPPLRRRQRAEAIVTAVLLVVTTAAVAAHAMRPLHASNVFYRRAGEFLRRRYGPEAVIISDNTWVCYYAGPPHRSLRTRRLAASRLVERLVRIDASEAYLALTEDGQRRDPATAPLLEGEAFALIPWTDPSGTLDEALRLYRVDLTALKPPAADAE